MNQWYYADAQRRQIGPVPASELVRLHQAGQVDDATLVWREGLANWQPLGTVRAELGLEAPVPPAPAPEAALPPADAAAPAAMAATAPAVLSPGADDVVYAGLWKRVAASLIDSLVTSTITYAAAIPLFLVYGVSTTALFGLHDLQDGPPLAFWAVYYLLALGLPALYFAWMHSSSTQASLGKMAVGVKVVRGDGQPVGFGRALLRYLAYLLICMLTCGLGALASALVVAFSARKQAPHDMMCDTLVVDRWAFTPFPERQQRGLGTVTIVVLAVFGLLTLGTLLVMGLVIGALVAHG
jgi:uncharacterized RDD family membrane protein YckC